MAAVPEAKRSLHALRERLAACDYQEVITFSFVEPQWEADLAGEANAIRLLNPIASQSSVMRTTLLGGLLANLRYNAARKLSRIRVFEVGRVFLRDASVKDAPLEVAGLRQPMRIGAAAYGPAQEEQWGVATRPVDLYDVKADVEALVFPLAARFEAAPHPAFHPGRSARIRVEGEDAGWIGELHPRWQNKYEFSQGLVFFEVDAAMLQEVPLPKASVPSRFPPVTRDIALLVNANVGVQELLDATADEKPAIVKWVRLFDLYQGSNLPAGKKSVAFRVVMQDTERTLTDAEADQASETLVALWGRRFAATLRT
jgi:phenylalanyl-tRNA synthetase beta chain